MLKYSERKIPDKFYMHPFLYHCTISFKLSFNSEQKMRKYSVFMKKLVDIFNEKDKHFFIKSGHARIYSNFWTGLGLFVNLQDKNLDFHEFRGPSRLFDLGRNGAINASDLLCALLLAQCVSSVITS